MNVPVVVVISGLSVATIAGSVPARRLWLLDDELLARASKRSFGKGVVRDHLRNFHALYLSTLTWLAGGWLVLAYKGFGSIQSKTRWLGPNSLAGWFELYLGVTLFVGGIAAGVVLGQTIYWFNRPRRLISPRLRNDLGVWAVRHPPRP